jgi:hypothetical protein
VNVEAQRIESGLWIARAKVEKYQQDISPYIGREHEFHGEFDPYDVIEGEPNMLMNGGISCLWQSLIGNGTATAGQNLTYFNNGNAAIGVGDSTTAAAATHTDLQAATNKLRRAMEATYPQHTDGTTAAANTITFRSSFATGDANFAWQEWGVFNSATAATGRMLNRKVESLGTKSSGTWTLTVTIQIT